MTYLAIYSISDHIVECEKEMQDGATVKDDVKIAPGDEYMADLPLVDYDYNRYAIDCRCRGGDWKVYKGDIPFDWELVTPKEEVEE